MDKEISNDQDVRICNTTENNYSEKKGPTTLNSTATLLKGGLGTGILLLPFTFKSCGIILSSLFMIITAFVCYFCWFILSKVIILIENKDKKNSLY